MSRSAYRCYLPVLTEFTATHCVGPDRHSCTRARPPRCRTRGPGVEKNGGDERARTADLLVANEALSQLSYIPTCPADRPGVVSNLTKKWRRERDSNPRNACALNGFRDRPIQPLWHLSGRILLEVEREGKSRHRRQNRGAWPHSRGGRFASSRRARRVETESSTRSFSSGVIPDHIAISSSVRRQPAQRSVTGSTEHRLVHGDGGCGIESDMRAN